MYLCLDVGNTQIHGGIVDNDKLIMDFRLNTKQAWSSDQLGVVIRGVLREREVPFQRISHIGICSVVPSIDHHLKNACLKYFNTTAIFIKGDLKTGLELGTFNNSHEIGADLIASAACALHDYPNQNLIIVDMGTATTIIAVNAQCEFLGGIILPGMQTQITSLAESAEKLFLTEIERPPSLLGKTTTQSIQSGLYYGQLGALSYLTRNVAKEAFAGEPCKIIMTGGFSRLFKSEELFELQVPDLVLRGMVLILKANSIQSEAV